MTGKTHRVGGMLCVLGCFSYLESRGLLIKNVDPVLQLAVMYPFALYGSIFPDLDHGEDSIPSKDIVSIAINKLLHATGWINDRFFNGNNRIFGILDARHRSWQTHSDLFLLLLMLLMIGVSRKSGISSTEFIIWVLLGEGFLLGVVSHLLLDMLTPEGIWCTISLIARNILNLRLPLPRKLSLVPDTRFFRTGGAWESIVRRILWCCCIILFLRLLFLMSPYRITFNY